jgi:hypothetical protein
MGSFYLASVMTLAIRTVSICAMHTFWRSAHMDCSARADEQADRAVGPCGVTAPVEPRHHALARSMLTTMCVMAPDGS